MSRQEVIDHIGTIAKSGTQEFFSTLTGDQTKEHDFVDYEIICAFITSNSINLDN